MSEQRNIRKALKSPDWFRSKFADLVQQMVDHKHGALIALGVVAAICAVALLGMHFMEKRQGAALAALAPVEADFKAYMEQLSPDPEKPSAAPKAPVNVPELEKRLQTVADQHSSADAGALARLYLAELYFRQGKFTEAVEGYRRYLDRLSSSAAYRGVVLSSIGYCLEALNKPKEAAESFLEAATLPNSVERDNAYLNAARLYEKAGDSKSARNYYQKLVDEFGDSQLLNVAKSRLAQLSK